MFVRMLVAAVLATFWLMIWGFLFWAVLLPENSGLLNVTRQDELARVLREHLPQEGTYYIPHAHQEHGDGAVDATTDGTIAMVHFAPAGGDPLNLATYGLGALHFFVTSFFLTILLTVALPALEGYRSRVLFMWGVALFGIVAIEWTDPVWYRVPWEYFLYVSGFLAVGWLGAALIIATLVYPSRGYTHVTDPGKPLWKRALDVD